MEEKEADFFEKILQVTEEGEGVIGGVSIRCAHTDQELGKFVAELSKRKIVPTITGHTLTWREPVLSIGEEVE